MDTVDIVVEGFDGTHPDPASGLMRVFGIDQATAQTIVQRVPLTVKRNVSLASAQPFEQALIKLGARVRLVSHGEPAPQRPIRQDTSPDGTPGRRRAAPIETALMHGGGWDRGEVPKVSLPGFAAVRPSMPAPDPSQPQRPARPVTPPPAEMRSLTPPAGHAPWRPSTPPSPEIARSVAPPRPNTPAPIDMSLPPPPVDAPQSLRDPNERVVLRSEPPPPPSFLTPDPTQRARTSKAPEPPRSIAPAQLFEAPAGPSIDLADDLPAESQRSGQWHAVRPVEFDATSRTTPFADDLMLPWVGTTPEPPRPTTPTRRGLRDRR